MVADNERTFAALDDRIEYYVRGAQRQNFGDYLPELFAFELLGPAKIEADVYRLVGSVIEDSWVRWDLTRANGSARGIIAFWMCGARRENPLKPETQALCRFFGVRGPLTRDALGLPTDTALGDPGLLAPLLHTPLASRRTINKTICIPHIYDPKSRDELLAISGTDELVHPEIDGTEAGLRAILNEIASAKFVLSGSLHGAIIACAYGVPFAFWNTGHIDSPFKWKDFAGSIGIAAQFVHTCAEGQALWADELSPVLTRPALTPMLDVCPFTVRPTVLVKALVHDRALDTVAGEQAAAALAHMPGSSLEAARAYSAASAAFRSQRERLGSLVAERALLYTRKLGATIAPRAIKRAARATRLRKG